MSIHGSSGRSHLHPKSSSYSHPHRRAHSPRHSSAESSPTAWSVSRAYRSSQPSDNRLESRNSPLRETTGSSSQHRHHRHGETSSSSRIETVVSRHFSSRRESSRIGSRSSRHSERARHHESRSHRHSSSSRHHVTRSQSSALPQLQERPVPHPLAERELITFHSVHQQQNNNPLRMICDTIRQAQRGIFMRIYAISSDDIIQSLIQTSHHVPVEVKYHCGESLPVACQNSRVVLRPTNGRTLQHKKTMLADFQTVVTGSANYTDLSLNHDVNVTACIESSELHDAVFSERPQLVHVGSQLLNYIPIQRLIPNAASKMILNAINQATDSIFVLMYIFLSPEFFLALAQAMRRGVRVKVIIDNHSKQDTCKLLSKLGIQLPLYERKTEGVLHTKICCINNKTLIFGSANWSGAGMIKNFEDLFILRPITETQLQAFMDVWSLLETNSSYLSPESVLTAPTPSSRPTQQDTDSDDEQPSTSQQAIRMRK